MFALPTNMIEVFITVDNLKNSRVVEIDSVSAELLWTLHLVIIFDCLIQFPIVFLSRSWFPKRKMFQKNTSATFWVT